MKRYIHPSFNSVPELLINASIFKYMHNKYAVVPTDLNKAAWIRSGKKYLRWSTLLKRWIKVPRVIGVFILNVL